MGLIVAKVNIYPVWTQILKHIIIYYIIFSKIQSSNIHGGSLLITLRVFCISLMSLLLLFHIFYFFGIKVSAT